MIKSLLFRAFNVLFCILGFCLFIPVKSFSRSYISSDKPDSGNSVIRINLLGYQPNSIKVAVWASTEDVRPQSFSIIETATGKIVYSSANIQHFGKYGPFKGVSRLNFSDFKVSGIFYIQVNNTISPKVRINPDVYKSTADFALKYMRQQRSGYNPYLKDSCHTQDGYTMYGPMRDSTRVDVSGGWHDASDYLQYSTTSANATYHLLAAYRDFPQVFTDQFQANGLEGNNGTPDILDEASWGLQWLLKMHPKKNWLFNQIADDRDHKGMRLPTRDSVNYGKGLERPVYFANGKPQGLGKHQNRATGTASVAGKFSSAFALGSRIYQRLDPVYSDLLQKKAKSAYDFGKAKPGVQQTAPMGAPYFYEEDNWTDDMELAAAEMYETTSQKKYFKKALNWAGQEKVTPWMGADTARHYQWYPFHNFGHYTLAKIPGDHSGINTMGYYQQGLDRVWEKAKDNGFYRGVPFIWCSNNLTASFTIQAYLYHQLTGDGTYEELAQANFDWLFGCNPWGTSMVYGLPHDGDTPEDPHSAFTHLYQYPIDGGLVDGPVYGSIFKNLIGITIYEPDEYAKFQSDLVVYHDDFGDYSTNEPTMDGTASLIYLLAAYENREATTAPAVQQTKPQEEITTDQGALIRGRTDQKKLALVFTGDEFADGGQNILSTLKNQGVKGSFFLTGRFYRNPEFKTIIQKLKNDGHYLGPHSNDHLLYCDWKKRDSLLVTKDQFKKDLKLNYQAIAEFGIPMQKATYFLPPYEWHNQTIAEWTKELNLTLVNFTPGTRSNADYTWPDLGKSYRPSDEIYASIVDYEKKDPNGLNGFLLLTHIGTDPKRTDKFYHKLDDLITYLKEKGYELVTVDQIF